MLIQYLLVKQGKKKDFFFCALVLHQAFDSKLLVTFYYFPDPVVFVNYKKEVETSLTQFITQ